MTRAEPEIARTNASETAIVRLTCTPGSLRTFPRDFQIPVATNIHHGKRNQGKVFVQNPRSAAAPSVSVENPRNRPMLLSQNQVTKSWELCAYRICLLYTSPSPRD